MVAKRYFTRPILSYCKGKIFGKQLQRDLAYLKTQTFPKVIEQPHVHRQSRSFHTSQRNNAIGPHIWAIVKLVMKGTSILTGRSFRVWWKGLPGDKKHHFIHFSKKQWKAILLGLSGTAAFSYAYYLSHLEAAPVTGRKRFIAFTEKQMEKIIEFAAEEVLEAAREDIVPNDNEFYPILSYILTRLHNANTDIEQVEKQKWTIVIVDEPDNINAFVLPSGHVFVYTGLLKFVQNEDELAIVLGHEMAHAILKHSTEEMSKQQVIDYFMIVIMAALWALMPGDGIAAVFNWFLHKVFHLTFNMPHSRELETEADKVGLELASKACFDIRSGTVLWTRFELMKKVKNQSIPQWLSTHPIDSKRVQFFDYFIPQYSKMRMECKCPPLPDKDPRENLSLLRNQIDNYVTVTKTKGNLERLKQPLQKGPYKKLTSSNLVDNSVSTTESNKDHTTQIEKPETKDETKNDVKLSTDNQKNMHVSAL